jgi:hypothetical protein
LDIFHIKYGVIILCLLFTIHYRKPLPALFTAIADWFLIFGASEYSHEIGVTVFCLAHLSYAVRFSGNVKWLPILAPFAVTSSIAAFLTTGGYLHFIAAVYAQCFALSLFFACKNFFAKSFPRKNAHLIIAGLTLFALCDVCVLIYNTTSDTQSILNLIWIFYIPSQILLALSAKDFFNNGTHGKNGISL